MLNGTLSISPTSVVSSNVYNQYLKIDWGKSTAGDNVYIMGYQLEYQTSDNTTNWGNTWTVQSTVDNVENSDMSTVINANFIDRGKYVRFRIVAIADKTDYNSEPSLVSNIIERCTIPTIITDIQTSISEFSNGEDFKLVWKHTQTKWSDNPIRAYEVRGAYENSDGTLSEFTMVANITVESNLVDGVEISLCFGNSSSANVGQTVNGKLTTSTTMLSTFYSNILNEKYAQLYVVPYDKYNTNTLLEENTIITISRYDRIGVAIGINGNWVDCRLFVGVNGSWVEQSVSVGINNQWVEADNST